MAEKCPHTTCSTKTGVRPCRPQVRRTTGRWENPLSSMNLIMAPVLSASFIFGHRTLRQLSMSASSRCLARRAGFWQLQPRLVISSHTWLLWYPTRRASLSACRCERGSTAQSRTPWARGPRSSSCSSRSCWASVSREGRPVLGRACRAPGPRSCQAVCHLLTADRLTPRARTTSACRTPWSNISAARKPHLLLATTEGGELAVASHATLDASGSHMFPYLQGTQ